MARWDFRSSMEDLRGDGFGLDAGDPIQKRAEQVLREVTVDLGLVEPDLMVVSEASSPTGQVVYDKFAVWRR